MVEVACLTGEHKAKFMQIYNLRIIHLCLQLNTLSQMSLSKNIISSLTWSITHSMACEFVARPTVGPSQRIWNLHTHDILWDTFNLCILSKILRN